MAIYSYMDAAKIFSIVCYPLSNLGQKRTSWEKDFPPPFPSQYKYIRF